MSGVARCWLSLICKKSSRVGPPLVGMRPKFLRFWLFCVGAIQFAGRRKGWKTRVSSLNIIEIVKIRASHNLIHELTTKVLLALSRGLCIPTVTCMIMFGHATTMRHCSISQKLVHAFSCGYSNKEHVNGRNESGKYKNMLQTSLNVLPTQAASHSPAKHNAIQRLE